VDTIGDDGAARKRHVVHAVPIDFRALNECSIDSDHAPSIVVQLRIFGHGIPPAKQSSDIPRVDSSPVAGDHLEHIQARFHHSRKLTGRLRSTLPHPRADAGTGSQEAQTCCLVPIEHHCSGGRSLRFGPIKERRCFSGSGGIRFRRSFR
jgi:hypothetical protein